jgi:hypothetical protein
VLLEQEEEGNQEGSNDGCIHERVRVRVEMKAGGVALTGATPGMKIQRWGV